MKDIELECLPQWRYTQMPRGTKGPRTRGWQRNPLALAQVDTHGNVGVLLGDKSNGIVAVDFDGASAFQFYSNTFVGEIPHTVMWTSGRDGRCQMAFTVEQKYWEFLETKKIATAEGEGFELRWTGTQSVLPPSLHPDTGKLYEWINPPSKTDLAPLPDSVLSWWLLECQPTEINAAETVYERPTEGELLDLARELKELYPSLDYETWTRVTWAFCNTAGPADGLAIMQYFYPEQRSGEYGKLIGGEPPQRRCTVGTIHYLINQRKTQRRVILNNNIF